MKAVYPTPAQAAGGVPPTGIARVVQPAGRVPKLNAVGTPTPVTKVFGIAPGIANGLYVAIVEITLLPGNVAANRCRSVPKTPSVVLLPVPVEGLRMA